jgi:radical SAM superfamily enzyme YgiQ (UPF0313 family)
MKIGLLALSGVRVQNPELAALGLTLPGFVRRGAVIASLPSLGLLTVAGLTPPEHQVTYLEVPDARSPEVFQRRLVQGPSPWPEFDLVGISSMTAQIDEAYRVADTFRSRGTPVVMGGLHVSALPEEALEHADAVVTGGAENAWPRVVADAAAGRLGGIYEGAQSGMFSGEPAVLPRFDLLAGRDYNRLTVQTSRGCPRHCEFCAASLRITRGYQQKPVAQVLAEIREARRHASVSFFELADDNTFLNPAWSKEFLKAVAGEGIHWFTETDLSVADDLELCDLLVPAGCRQLLIGFESPESDDLRGLDPAGWKQRRAPECRRVIDALQSRGVSVNGCFTLGLDHQTPDVFPQLLEFVRSSGLAEVQVTVLTPFPGTPLYHRLQREGRLLTPRFWERCTLFDVAFRPARMSLEDLESGLRWLMGELYSRSETNRRQRGFVTQKMRATLAPAAEFRPT